MYPLCIIISDRCYENSEHCESSTKVASGTFGSLCITGFEEFDKHKLIVAEIVNPFNTFQMENCSVVITDPSPKYLKLYTCVFSDECDWLMKASNINESGMYIIRAFNTEHRCSLKDREYLKLARYDKWSRIYAPVHRGWSMTSNIAESINATLVSTRELPIYDFLEEVRLMFGRWDCDNKKEASFTFTPLIEKIQEILKINEAMSTRLMSTGCLSTEYVHNVNDKGSDKFCSNLYKPTILLKTYDFPIYPLLDKIEWFVPRYIMAELVLPPIFKRPPVRSRKKFHDKSARDF
ncbi:hypothetical protein H5410_061274 [Solanum commersonii]|uniref:Uncharacterized protein n=1 Tax=Solanum commersonii TaxID=4109 RepID=A0A9J5W8E9_SOLCO|nr:hypothetical protein H5410_061274 [Solanum commersonii]